MSEFRKSSLLPWGLPSFYGQVLGQACRHGGWHFFRKPLLMMASGFWPLFSIGSWSGLDCPWGLCPGKPRCLLGQPAGGPVAPRPGPRAVFTRQLTPPPGCPPDSREDKDASLSSLLTPSGSQPYPLARAPSFFQTHYPQWRGLCRPLRPRRFLFQARGRSFS